MFRTALATLFLAVPAGWTAFAGPMPEIPKSAFWEPYSFDDKTVALYHFDGGQNASVDDILDGKETDAATQLIKENTSSPAKDSSGGASCNSVSGRERLQLSGACAETPDIGRFGGGLRFEGKDGMALGTLPDGPCTVEFWARPEKFPEAPATLAEIGCGKSKPPAVRLLLQPDGSLTLDWKGLSQNAPDTALKPGQWTHIAISWDGKTVVEFRIDGKKAAFQNPLGITNPGELRQFALGNGFDAKNGFLGAVDELRISRDVRAFYPWELRWADLDGSLGRSEGQPFFRDPADLILHMDFNRTLKPVSAPAGTIFPELGADIIGDKLQPDRWKRYFADGVEREGLLLKQKGLDAKLRGTGLANPDHGTVAFWIRPLDWHDEVRWCNLAVWPMLHVPVFTISQGDANAQPALSLSLVRTPDEGVLNPIGFHPGRWVHLACTWEGKKEKWFVDGQPWTDMGSLSWRRAAWDAGKPVTLLFNKGDSGCEIDDFRIYSRPLAPCEIRNLAALYDKRKEPQPLSPFEMIVRYNGVIGYVDVEFFPLHPDYSKAASATVAVSAKGAAEPLASQNFDLSKEFAPGGRINTPPMDFGEYEVEAVAQDAAGKALFSAKTEFKREPPPWWKNKIGVSDKVMPGWTPVVISHQSSVTSDPAGNGLAEQTVIGVILRDIHFNGAALPAKIISAGEDILAGPVALTAKIAEKEVPLASVPGAFRAERKGEVRADFSGRAEGGGITADIKGYIEFDGMMWFQITLSGASATVQSLTLSIPFAEDSSRLMHWWSGAHGFRNPKVVHIGAVPAGEGIVFSSLDKERVQLHDKMRGSFIPYLMLTGDRRGLAWFAENDKGWTQSAEKPAVTVVRQGKAVIINLNIISEPIPLKEPRTFEFGLHPIPVKNLEPGWRMTPNWGVFPDSFCGFNLKGPRGSTQFFRHPDGMDWEMAKRRYDGLDGSLGANNFVNQFLAQFRREYGRDPMPNENCVEGLYYDLTNISGFPDDTREWGETWWPQRYTPEINDYCAWIWDQWLRHGLAKGIYYDDCYNHPMDAWPSPVSYKLSDGSIQPGFQWRQPREHLKRTRQTFIDNGLRPYLCAHTTHTNFIPYHSFFDVILDGEDFYQAPGEDRDFMDSWPPDRLRFMNSEKWGLISTWLGWHKGGDGGRWGQFKTKYWQHWRAYTAGLLIHDLVWTVGMGSHHEVDSAWLKSSRLCLDPETKFVGYWDPASPASHRHPGLYVSVWKRPGWCAAAVVNYGKERIEAEVRLDLKAMGFDGAAETVTVKDVDSSLIRYFDDDITKYKKPEASKVEDIEGGKDDLADLGLEEAKTADQRKAADPDAKFEWKDGILKCPVRRHDFRLFEFKTGTAGQ